MKLKSTILIAFAAIFMVGLNSCKDNGMDPVNDLDTDANQEMILVDLGDELDFIIQIGTLDQDFMIQHSNYYYFNMDGDDDDCDDCGKDKHKHKHKHGKGHKKDMPGKRMGHKGDFGHNDAHHDKRDKGRFGDDHKFGRVNLERVIYQLDLTDAQYADVLFAREAYVDCIRTVRETLFANLQPLFERAKNARAGVIEDLRAGTITREEAKEKINNINTKLWEYINSQNYFQNAFLAMQDCRETFFTTITLLLDDEQLVIWNKYIIWLADYKCEPWKDRDDS